jgi:hypothetical protein
VRRQRPRSWSQSRAARVPAVPAAVVGGGLRTHVPLGGCPRIRVPLAAVSGVVPASVSHLLQFWGEISARTGTCAAGCGKWDLGWGRGRMEERAARLAVPLAAVSGVAPTSVSHLLQFPGLPPHPCPTCCSFRGCPHIRVPPAAVLGVSPHPCPTCCRSGGRFLRELGHALPDVGSGMREVGHGVPGAEEAVPGSLEGADHVTDAASYRPRHRRSLVPTTSLTQPRTDHVTDAAPHHPRATNAARTARTTDAAPPRVSRNLRCTYRV